MPLAPVLGAPLFKMCLVVLFGAMSHQPLVTAALLIFLSIRNWRSLPLEEYAQIPMRMARSHAPAPPLSHLECEGRIKLMPPIAVSVMAYVDTSLAEKIFSVSK